MFDVALSRRMCCSRVASVRQKPGLPSASVVRPARRPGIWRFPASRHARNPTSGPPNEGARPNEAASPQAMSISEAPGASEIDIACGEAASFGLAPSFGGPLVGFLACRDAGKRQIPGRLAGRTTDADGKPGFCLTLATREQHIRRERATSNICTNQGLFALAATMTLSVLGKQGLRETAVQCLSKAEYLKAGVEAIPGPFSVAFSGKTFNEFALRCGVPVDEVLRRAEERKILAGVPYARLEPAAAERRDLLLVAVTERTPRSGLDAFLDTLRSFS